MKIENIINIWIPRFLLCVSISLLISAKGLGQLPTATIGGTTTVCQDAPFPNITFTGANGTPPYTFTYSDNFGTTSITTTSGNSVTVPVPTGTSGTFTYTLISVTDATNTNQAQSGTAVVTVSPLPVPTITGPAAACLNSTGNIYTTELGMSSYSWSLTGGTISAGSLTNAITVTWNTSGAQSVSVNYNNANNCPAASPTVYAVTVDPLPVPTITGPAAACINSSGNTYSTEPGMTSYAWSVTAGGTITAGLGTRAITVTWSTSGTQSVSVNYINANNCTATSATVNAVTVDPLPVPTITGPAAVCLNSTGNTYTTESGMSGYSWSVTGGTITAGLGTRAITVTWSTLGAQSVSVNYNNANNCTATSVTVHAVTVYPLPVPTITGSAIACLNSIGNIYTTETGMSSYSWSVTGGTITAGIGTNTITVTWNTSGAQSVSVNYNNANNCPAASATVHTVTVDPSPVPTITGPVAVCINSTGNIYTTETGMSSYSWSVTGGTITAGIGTNAITVTWNTLGAQSVSVNYNNANNCPAASATVHAVTVDPLPVPTITGPVAICINSTGNIYTTETGMSSYSWSVTGGTITAGIGTNAITVTWNTSGDQSVRVNYTNANNCTSASATVYAVIVNLLPIPTLTSSDADNIFCAGTSVTFTAAGGSTYNFRIGGITFQNGTSTTYTTSLLTNGQVVDVVVSNRGGCTATSTAITNTVNPQPNASAGIGGSICGLAFKLNAVPSVGVGTWTKTTGPGTATFSPNTNTAGATVTVSDYGAYTFTWTEVNGQCSSSSVVAVTFLLQPVANAGTGGNNCGLGFHLNGTMNAGTGTWAKVSGPGNVSFSPNAGTTDALVTVTTFGTYTFSWTVLNGTCSNSANVSVVFIQEISANGGSGGDVCVKSFSLNAMVPANGTGTWSKYRGPGNATFLPDIHQSVAQVTVDQFGVYDFAWTVASGTCTSSDIVRVVFHDLPLINAGRDTAMCKGGSVQLMAVGIGSVSWTPVKLLSNSNIINPIASPDTTTKFTVHLTDQFGCKNADSIIVEVRNKVVADAGPDQLLNSVFSTQLAAKLAHSYEKGIWSIISGTGEFKDSTNATTVVSGLSSGINKLFWIVTNGYCPPSGDSTNITVTNFVIPTMITPNMDGRNDYFIIGGLTNQSKTELLIFDRRGVQVYKNLNYDNSWNGVDYNKNPLPDDTYFYVLKYADGKSYRGYIVIRR